jgi:hypothetical protein
MRSFLVLSSIVLGIGSASAQNNPLGGLGGLAGHSTTPRPLHVIAGELESETDNYQWEAVSQSSVGLPTQPTSFTPQPCVLSFRESFPFQRARTSA